MLKLSSSLAIAGAIFSMSFLVAAPALALSPVTYVSGKGTNTGTCASPASPCRSFQFAANQTSAGGEIKALDPAHYGPVVITKSISITGVEGAGIFRAAIDSSAISIKAGSNDTINLSYLTLDGFNTAATGITLSSGGSLNIAHCSVRNFQQYGIALLPTAGTTRFFVADVTVSSNGVHGILIFPAAPAVARGTLDHVLMDYNDSSGLSIARNATGAIAEVTVTDSVAKKSGTGYRVSSQGLMLLLHSAATDNDVGVHVNGGTAESAGNNFIRGNSVDVSGALTNVGTR